MGLQTLVLNLLASLVLGPLNSEGIIPLAFGVPWLADSRWWDFTVSITVYVLSIDPYGSYLGSWLLNPYVYR